MNYGELSSSEMLFLRPWEFFSSNGAKEVSDAMKEFHEKLLAFGDDPQESVDKPAEGFTCITQKIKNDWLRCGIKIGGKFYPGNSGEEEQNIDMVEDALEIQNEISAKNQPIALPEGDSSQDVQAGGVAGNAVAIQQMVSAEEQLIALCNGDSNAALWLSSFANQGVFCPFYELFKKLPIKIKDDDYLNINFGSISFAFSALDGAGVRLDVGYQWDPHREAENSLFRRIDKKMDYVIGADSRFSANFSLKFDMPEKAGVGSPVVSILESLKYEAQIFIVQLVEEDWEMHPGDNIEIEIFVEETRGFSYVEVNANSSGEYPDPDDEVEDGLVKVMGVDESPPSV